MNCAMTCNDYQANFMQSFDNDEETWRGDDRGGKANGKCNSEQKS